MASVNKASLREEFERLKGQFERLCAEGKMGEDSRALFQALLTLFELLMAVFMEKHTPKNSRNSSLPPSQTNKDDSALQTGAKAKGRTQTHTRSENTRTVETVEILPVMACERCGEDLHHRPADGYERRTRIDIVFEKVVSHVDAEIKYCPQCRAHSKATFPAQMPGPLQYGPGIKAYVLNLLLAQMLSLKRVQQSIHTLIDRRGHGLCGSHLLRELTFVVDSNGYRWAHNLKRLLQQTCALVAKRQDKCLTDAEYRNLQKRYRNLLTRGGKELPPIPPKPDGKRGRVAKSDAHNLWERLQRHEQAVLLFANLPHVPFTNNRAERDLRMSKVKQKVSGCFRTFQYAQAYCRISSYLQTMAYRGYNPLVAIQMALSGQIYVEGGE